MKTTTQLPQNLKSNKKSTTSIFEVDLEGLRQLQEAKPKWFIIRELIQNALDEDITKCQLEMNYKYGIATISVIDDSPTGFRDLSDAYTLFKDTYKRSNAQKRGRFNFGEKQVLCLCDYALIKSTTGGYEFDLKKGIKTRIKTKTERGSVVTVKVRLTQEDFHQCRQYCNELLIPQNISVVIKIQDEETSLQYIHPHKSFKTNLPTEVKQDDRMRILTRETVVNLHERNGLAYLYELGIPVCEIDCDYSIDVQQKIPLSNDRDKVDGKYLKILYGEVLNQTCRDLSPDQSSQLWVRAGTTSERASGNTVREVFTKRFGEKAVIANPRDRNSIDDAISNGYNVVYGAEMDKEEWKKVKEHELMVSTSQMFPTNGVNGTLIVPNEPQTKIARFCQRVAADFLQFHLTVIFLESPQASNIADFGNDTIRFNVSKISKSQFEPSNGRIQQKMLDLVIHELGHKCGNHTEHSYHQCITELGSRLTIKALIDPTYFDL